VPSSLKVGFSETMTGISGNADGDGPMFRIAAERRNEERGPELCVVNLAFIALSGQIVCNQAISSLDSVYYLREIVGDNVVR